MYQQIQIHFKSRERSDQWLPRQRTQTYGLLFALSKKTRREHIGFCRQGFIVMSLNNAYYEALEINRTASDAEIKKAWVTFKEINHLLLALSSICCLLVLDQVMKLLSAQVSTFGCEVSSEKKRWSWKRREVFPAGWSLRCPERP